MISRLVAEIFVSRSLLSISSRGVGWWLFLKFAMASAPLKSAARNRQNPENPLNFHENPRKANHTYFLFFPLSIEFMFSFVCCCFFFRKGIRVPIELLLHRMHLVFNKIYVAKVGSHRILNRA